MSSNGSTVVVASEGDDDTNVVELDSEVARRAFEAGDGSASRAFHESKTIPKESDEKHTDGGDYVKSFVYGGVDGIVSTFATVSGISGANLSTRTILILGFANLIADGLAMGIGDYISSKSEHEFATMERQRELWECEHNLKAEKEEMMELYTKRGMDPVDATRLVDILSKNHEHFVDVMMVEELGILPPDPDEDQMKMGLVTFGSFCLFGLVPMASYVYATIFGVKAPQERFNGLFISCAILTLGTLFVLGAITARFTSSDWKKSGGWLVLTGGIASAAAFFIGYVLNEVVKVPTTV